MTVVIGLDWPTQVVDRAQKEVDAFLSIMGHRPETAPGTRRASDEELLALVDRMLQQYPPEPLIKPDGTQVVASRWLASRLEGNVEGANEDMKQLQRLIEKRGYTDG